MESLEETVYPLVTKPNRYVRPFEPWFGGGGTGAGKLCLVFAERVEGTLIRVETRSLLEAVSDRARGSETLGVDVLFVPDPDLDLALRERAVPQHGLATREPLPAFDVLLCPVFEALHLPDLVRLLEEGGIPTSSRGPEHPIVIACGDLALDPGVLFPFVDAVLLGDPEAFVDVLADMAERRRRGLSKSGLIEDLARLPGVLISSAEPRPGRWAHELPRSATPLVPLIETGLSGLLFEIARPVGVDHPGAAPAPLRVRTLESVLRDAEVALAATGEAELVLAGGGAGRHPDLPALLESLNRRLGPHDVEVRLPGLDASALVPTVARELVKGGRGRVTLYPLLPSARLRRVVGRGFEADDLQERLALLWRGGWSSIKMSLLLGHPEETAEDRDEACALLSGLLERTNASPRVTVEFIPFSMTGTPRIPPAPAALFEDTAALWTRRLRRDKLKITLHSPQRARAESLLRGAGAHAAETIRDLAQRGQHADLRASIPDAWVDQIAALSSDSIARPVAVGPVHAAWDAPAGASGPGFGIPGWLATDGRRPRRVGRGRESLAADRYRLRYTKGEPLRFLSHLDLTRVLERALRRAQVPVARSRGKDPRPRIAYGPPLPLGMTSAAEVVDLTLSREIGDSFVALLDDVLPEGIRITALAPIRREPASLSSAITVADYEVSFPDVLIRTGLGSPTFDELKTRLETAVASALSGSRLSVLKHRGEEPRTVNARPSLLDAGVVRDDGGRPLLTLRLALNRPDSVRPEALTAALCEGTDLDERLLRVHRSNLFIPGRNELLDPLDVVASGFAWWRQPVRGGTVL